MSATLQATQAAAKQPSPKQQPPRGSKEKQQAQAKDAKATSPSVAKVKDTATGDARRGRHSLPDPGTSQPESKKLTRRSSKPIFDWFQRKLVGTVRARRASESARANRGHGHGHAAAASASIRDAKRPPLPDSFHALTRTHSTPSRSRSSGERIRRRSHAIDIPGAQPMQAAVSLDDNYDMGEGEDPVGENSTYRSSLAHESLWSPTSNLEADEDASVRPLPPSSPPSPSPSRSSSSYLSDPRTFRSLAASTKPTTLLSVDLAGGLAHIAQAPPTPSSTFHRIGMHSRTGGGGSISSAAPIHFSALPAGHSPSQSLSGDPSQHISLAPPVQAPQLTHYHPRNNPRPSSPPPDNASVLTLASSAFGIPGARPGIVASADAMSDSQFSHFGGSRAALEDRASGVLLSDDFEGDRDVDASMRALRPRSSRRGSWESEASGWSAKMGPGGSTVALGPGTPLHDRNHYWAASFKTSELDDGESVAPESTQFTEPSPISDMQPSTPPLLSGIAQEPDTDTELDATLPTPKRESHSEGDQEEHESVSGKDAATPRHATTELAPIEAPPPLPTSISSDSSGTSATLELRSERPEALAEEKQEPGVEQTQSEPRALKSGSDGSMTLANSDTRSVASGEVLDLFVTASSTPLPTSLPVTPAAA